MTSAVSVTQLGGGFMINYYTALSRTPDVVHQFYSEESNFTFGSEDGNVEDPAIGSEEIGRKILSLGLQDCTVNVSTADCQSSIDGGVLIMVIGDMSNSKAQSPRQFSQTFFLALRPNGTFYVRNDIFRFIKEPAVAPAASVAPAPVPEASAAPAQPAGSLPAKQAAAARVEPPVEQPQPIAQQPAAVPAPAPAPAPVIAAPVAEKHVAAAAAEKPAAAAVAEKPAAVAGAPAAQPAAAAVSNGPAAAAKKQQHDAAATTAPPASRDKGSGRKHDDKPVSKPAAAAEAEKQAAAEPQPPVKRTWADRVATEAAPSGEPAVSSPQPAPAVASAAAVAPSAVSNGVSAAAAQQPRPKPQPRPERKLQHDPVDFDDGWWLFVAGIQPEHNEQQLRDVLAPIEPSLGRMSVLKQKGTALVHYSTAEARQRVLDHARKTPLRLAGSQLRVEERRSKTALLESKALRGGYRGGFRGSDRNAEFVRRGAPDRAAPAAERSNAPAASEATPAVSVPAVSPASERPPRGRGDGRGRGEGRGRGSRGGRGSQSEPAVDA
eukprot:TRINITY_DN2778_c0_g1_i1.p1 TRINITY_DN2778_c0_g1~~TRINITY_DN2778_c0_g1_i1.p1  ORF type:complete len:549 (+),score=190.78 TRINITY_DN2778_c0_g1_i1:53-1699(+)